MDDTPIGRLPRICTAIAAGFGTDGQFLASRHFVRKKKRNVDNYTGQLQQRDVLHWGVKRGKEVKVLCPVATMDSYALWSKDKEEGEVFRGFWKRGSDVNF